MFRVIVAGGIALTAGAPTLAAGCGGAVAPQGGAGDAASDAFPVTGREPGADAFPMETASESDAFPTETAPAADAFPTEGPAMILDSGGGGGDSGGIDAFPTEGPALLDSGPTALDGGAPPNDAATGLPDGFPQETAQQ
jgi:hypothetical protein